MLPRHATIATLLLCSALALAATAEQKKPAKPAAPNAPAPVHGFKVVRSYPHDRQAFTQGLEFVDGVLYESTGMNGRSGIRKVNLATGEVLQVQPLDAAYFGEGITVWKDRIVQLTWQSGIGFVYDRQIFMSDGSDSGTLRLLDPTTLRQVGTLAVKDAGRPVAKLNELEYVKGEIFANVWTTERIAVISPSTGRVTAWIDLQGLLDPRERAGVDVLNGIAYDAKGDRLFVTGKLWPRIFEIQVVRP
jgi:glutamine cyclotransferase